MIVLGTKNQLEVIIAITLPYDIGSRLTNVGSNLIWPYLLFTSGNLNGCSMDEHTDAFVIGLMHIFILLLGILMNIVMCIVGKVGISGKIYKIFIYIATFSFLACLGLMIIGKDNKVAPGFECIPLKFIKNSYILVHPISIFGMLLLLC